MIGILSFAILAVLDASSYLASALEESTPNYFTKEHAILHAEAASRVETKEVPAALLLSIVYFESRYNSGATSYVLNGKRKANVPKWAWSNQPPRGVTGPYFCGVTQVSAKMSWKRCLEMRDVNTAYSVAVKEVSAWLKVCRRHRDKIRCALLGYGGGFPAIERGTATYPSRVLSRARLITNKLSTIRKKHLQNGAPSNDRSTQDAARNSGISGGNFWSIQSFQMGLSCRLPAGPSRSNSMAAHH